MKTSHKILLASMAYRGVHFGRSLLGKSDVGQFDRHGIRYELNLAEGIDFSIYLRGHFEPTTAAAISREVKNGNVALDIGANIGAHTLGLAAAVGDNGRVLAFEPTDYAHAKLLKNISLNPRLAKRIKTFKCFLSSDSATTAPSEIHSSWPLTGQHAAHEGHLGKLMTSAAAQAIPLDEVVQREGIDRVDVVKMDVDGFECQVLRGAQQTISKYKPIFIMELSPYVLSEQGDGLDEFLSFFEPNGYKFFDESTNALT